MLSPYDVTSREAGKPKAAGDTGVFETSHQRSWSQLKPCALDEAACLKALKLEGYAPRSPVGQTAP